MSNIKFICDGTSQVTIIGGPTFTVASHGEDVFKEALTAALEKDTEKLSKLVGNDNVGDWIPRKRSWTKGDYKIQTREEVKHNRSEFAKFLDKLIENPDSNLVFGLPSGARFMITPHGQYVALIQTPHNKTRKDGETVTSKARNLAHLGDELRPFGAYAESKNNYIVVAHPKHLVLHKGQMFATKFEVITELTDELPIVDSHFVSVLNL